MTKISVALLTFNEEKNVADCLESVKWADEIVVFDEKSSDKTVTIAKKYTSKVFLVDHGSNSGRTHDTMFHVNKQRAIDKCSGDWVLQIDADERVTPELKEEILSVTSSDASYTGYQIPRRNIIFGKVMEHTGWYPDYQVKLFRKGQGEYPTKKSVHEDIKVSGEVGKIKSDLIHYHYSSIEQFVDRLNRYTTNDATVLLARGETVEWSDAIKFPADEFFKRFFYWEGYKDGLHGLVLSLLQAFGRLVVFAKMWEQQEFKKFGDEKFLPQVVDQSHKVARDWHHWLMVATSNPAKRFVYKLRNKLVSL